MLGVAILFYFAIGLITNMFLIRYVDGCGDDLFFVPGELITCLLFWPAVWFLAFIVWFLLFPLNWILNNFIKLCRKGLKNESQ